MRTSLALEVVCLVAVVAITAVLVVVTPARSEMSPGVVEKMVEIGDIGLIQVTVAPAATGANQVHLYTFDAAARPVEHAQCMTLSKTERRVRKEGFSSFRSRSALSQ